MNTSLMIGLIESGKDGLRRTFEAVPDDRLNWKPLDNGRSAFDLFGEAAQIGGFVARVVASRGEEKPSPELFARLREERANWTREQALEELETQFANLRDELAQISEEELALPVTMPMARGMTMPLAGWAMMAYRTYTSRFAQINYIQTLYGDFESH